MGDDGRNIRRILVVSLLLRLALVAYTLRHDGPLWFFERGTEMGLIADSLNRGTGFGSPFGVPTGPTAMVAPGYPLLTAVIFRVFGTYTWQAAFALMGISALCNGATAVVIYRLGRRMASAGSAFAVAMFWTCSLPMLWMPTIFWETSLSTLAVIVLVDAMVAVEPGRRWGFWAAWGCFCGCAGLLNPSLLLALVAVVAYALYRTALRGRVARDGVAFVAGFVVVFCGWPVRNAVTMRAVVLTRTTVGLELWMGNQPGAEGYVEPSLFPTYNAAELARYKQLGETRYMAEKEQAARQFIAAESRRFALLTCRRIGRFWLGAGTRAGSWLFVAHSTCTLVVGMGGLWLLWRERKVGWCVPLVLPLLLFPLPYYVTHAEFRYRLVIDPVLVALGAKALDAAWERVSGREGVARGRMGRRRLVQEMVQA